MAILNCGLFSFEFQYVAFNKRGGYDYSLRIYLKRFHLFSDSLDGVLLPDGETFLFSSDEEDKLLNAFELLISDTTPIDTEIPYESERSREQVVFFSLLKRDLFENQCRYIIRIRLNARSFLNSYRMGEMVITGITDSLDDLQHFVSTMKADRENLKTTINGRPL